MADNTNEILLRVQVEQSEAIKKLAETRKKIEELRAARKALDLTTEEGRRADAALGAQLQALNATYRDNQRAVADSMRATQQHAGSVDRMRTTLRTLRAEYTALSAAQRNSDRGRALQASIRRMTGELRDLNSQARETSGIMGRLPTYFSNLYAILTTQVIGGITQAVGAFKAWADEGVRMAGEAEGISAAFERLNKPDLLDGLRKATKGTVTDLELMKAAVKAQNFNIPLDKLGTLLKFAQQRAKETGESVEFLVSSIVNGLGRKSAMILDNLGISAARLSAEAKRTGDFTAAATKIIEEELTKQGDLAETATDRANRRATTLANKQREFGEAVGDVYETWDKLKQSFLDSEFFNGFLKMLATAGNAVNNLAKEWSRFTGTAQVNLGTEEKLFTKEVEAQFNERRKMREYEAATDKQIYEDILAERKRTSAEALRVAQQEYDKKKKLAEDFARETKALEDTWTPVQKFGAGIGRAIGFNTRNKEAVLAAERAEVAQAQLDWADEYLKKKEKELEAETEIVAQKVDAVKLANAEMARQKALFKLRQDIAKAEFDLAQLKAADQAAAFRAVAADEKKTFEERRAAWEQFLATRRESLQRQQEYETEQARERVRQRMAEDQTGLTGAAKELEYARLLEAELGKIRENGLKHLEDLNAETEKFVKAELEGLRKLMAADTAADIEEAKRRYAKALKDLDQLTEISEGDRAIMRVRIARAAEKEITDLKLKAHREQTANDLAGLAENARLRLDREIEAAQEVIRIRREGNQGVAADEAALAELQKRRRAVDLETDLLLAGKNERAKYLLRKKFIEDQLNNEKLGVLERQKLLKELDDLDVKFMDGQKDRLLGYLSEAAEGFSALNGLFKQLGENRVAEAEAAADAERQALERRLAAGYISQKEFNRKSAALDKELSEKKAAQARKDAIRDRARAIFDIGLSTAKAIMSALNFAPPMSFIFSAAAGAIGAAQLATVAATPLPRAAKGMYVRGPSHAGGGTRIEAEGGEAVINKKSTKAFLPLLSAMNVAGGGVPFVAPGADGGFAVREEARRQPPVVDVAELAAAMAASMREVQIYTAVTDINTGESMFTNVTDRKNV